MIEDIGITLAGTPARWWRANSRRRLVAILRGDL